MITLEANLMSVVVVLYFCCLFLRLKYVDLTKHMQPTIFNNVIFSKSDYSVFLKNAFSQFVTQKKTLTYIVSRVLSPS